MDFTGGQVLQTESLDLGRGFKYVTCNDCGGEQVHAKYQTKCRKCGKSFPFDQLAKLLVKSLNKGEKGDWQAEGYSLGELSHHNIGDGHARLHMKDNQGSVVGKAIFEKMPSGHWNSTSVYVHPDHQRKGIASAMYNHFQEQTGNTLTPHHNQSPEGQALWSNKSKPFGQTPKSATFAGSDEETK
jgi:GNAT superfamily N-acetyltransferase